MREEEEEEEEQITDCQKYEFYQRVSGKKLPTMKSEQTSSQKETLSPAVIVRAGRHNVDYEHYVEL